MGSVSITSPQSLTGAQALVYSKGVSKTEWDEVLTTTKNAAKDNTEKSVLGWECHHKQPQCTQQDCGTGPPGDSIRAQEPTQVPMAGRG